MNTIKEYLGKVSVTTAGEHEVNKNYDRLSIVYVVIDSETDAVKSYISKKSVPAGISITDKEYWQPFSMDYGSTFTIDDKTKLNSIELGATKGIIVRLADSDISLLQTVELAFDNSFGLEGDNDGYAQVHLAIANNNTKGGIKLGYTEHDDNYAVKLDNSHKAYVTVPKNKSIIISSEGEEQFADVLYFEDSNINCTLEYQEGDGYIAHFNVPEADDTTLGLIKLGYTTDISNRNYAVQVNNSNDAYVNVPWENTTYDVATQSNPGLMNPRDKEKLDNLSSIAIDGLTFKTGSASTTGINAIRVANGSGLIATLIDDDETIQLENEYATTEMSGVVKLGYIKNTNKYPLKTDALYNAYVEIKPTTVVIPISDIDNVASTEIDAIYEHLRTYGTFDNLFIKIDGGGSDSVLSFNNKISSWSMYHVKTASVTDSSALMYFVLVVECFASDGSHYEKMIRFNKSYPAVISDLGL